MLLTLYTGSYCNPSNQLAIDEFGRRWKAAQEFYDTNCFLFPELAKNAIYKLPELSYPLSVSQPASPSSWPSRTISYKLDGRSVFIEYTILRMISHDRLLLLRLCFPPFVVIVGIIALYTTYLHKRAKVASCMYMALKLVRRLLLRPAEVNLTLYIGEQNTPAWQRQRRIAVVEGGQRQHRRRDIRQSSSCLLYSSLEWGSHNNNITNKLEAPLCGL